MTSRARKLARGAGKGPEHAQRVNAKNYYSASCWCDKCGKLDCICDKIGTVTTQDGIREK